MIDKTLLSVMVSAPPPTNFYTLTLFKVQKYSIIAYKNARNQNFFFDYFTKLLPLRFNII